MEAIGATEFKAHCLELLDKVNRTGEPLLVTKRGKPTALVSRPPDYAGPVFEIGKFDGMVEIVGDIIEPLDVEWEVLK
jgi:prevent-host-death family protein